MIFKTFFGILQYTGSAIDKLMSHTFIGISQGFIQSALKVLDLPTENLSVENLR